MASGSGSEGEEEEEEEDGEGSSEATGGEGGTTSASDYEDVHTEGKQDEEDESDDEGDDGDDDGEDGDGDRSRRRQTNRKRGSANRGRGEAKGPPGAIVTEKERRRNRKAREERKQRRAAGSGGSGSEHTDAEADVADEAGADMADCEGPDVRTGRPPEDEGERAKRVAANRSQLSAEAEAVLAGGVMVGRIPISPAEAELFPGWLESDMKELESEWRRREYVDGGASQQAGGDGPRTCYPSREFIANRLTAIKWIVGKVVQVVGQLLQPFRGLTVLQNSPGACQPLHPDVDSNACRIVINVPFGDAVRWVQLTRGYGRKTRVVWEALLRHALQMYVMSGAARGPRYFRHTGNDGLTGDVLTLVLTFADGVDLDDALWAALEAAYDATHDAAGAGAPAGRSSRTAIAPRGGCL